MAAANARTVIRVPGGYWLIRVRSISLSCRFTRFRSTASGSSRLGTMKPTLGTKSFSVWLIAVSSMDTAIVTAKNRFPALTPRRRTFRKSPDSVSRCLRGSTRPTRRPGVNALCVAYWRSRRDRNGSAYADGNHAPCDGGGYSVGKYAYSRLNSSCGGLRLSISTVVFNTASWYEPDQVILSRVHTCQKRLPNCKVPVNNHHLLVFSPQPRFSYTHLGTSPWIMLSFSTSKESFSVETRSAKSPNCRRKGWNYNGVTTSVVIHRFSHRLWKEPVLYVDCVGIH